MSFVQTIHISTADGAALSDHLASWHKDQLGVAPGYQGYRLLTDRDHSGEFLVLIDFSSAAEASENDTRPETARWAATLRSLSTTAPRFTNFDTAASSGH